MSKDRIQSAITLGSARTETGDDEVMYEGHGPAGAGFLVECYTNNRRRTAPALRAIFAKYGGKIAEPGAVLWQFNKVGVLIIERVDSPVLRLPWTDSVLELAASLAADDVDVSDEDSGLAEIVCDWKKLLQVRRALQSSLTSMEQSESPARIVSATTVWRPAQEVDVPKVEDREMLVKLRGALEEYDDVQAVYHSGVIEPP